MNLSALEAKVTSDEGKQELNRLKMALNEAELLKQKFSGAPAAIDFAAYKGKVDASLLALAEKEFKGVQYPPFAELDAPRKIRSVKFSLMSPTEIDDTVYPRSCAASSMARRVLLGPYSLTLSTTTPMRFVLRDASARAAPLGR